MEAVEQREALLDGGGVSVKLSSLGLLERIPKGAILSPMLIPDYLDSNCGAFHCAAAPLPWWSGERPSAAD